MYIWKTTKWMVPTFLQGQHDDWAFMDGSRKWQTVAILNFVK